MPVAGYAVAFDLLWTNLRPPPEASFWGPYQSIPKAIGEAVTISPDGLALAWLVAPLVFLGLWACFQDRWQRVWIAAVFALFTYLFVVVSGFTKSETRDFLTGVWYNDSYRIAALLPLVAVLLVAVGIDWAGRRILAMRGRSKALDAWPWTALRAGGAPEPRPTGPWRRRPSCWPPSPWDSRAAWSWRLQQGSRNYRLAADSPLVSPTSLPLMKRLPRLCPKMPC